MTMYPPTTPTATDVSDKAPLPFIARAKLLTDCLPFIVFLIITLLCITVLRDLFASRPIFYLFMGVVLLVLGFQAVQRLRDLIPGTVNVETDFLTNSYRSRYGRGTRRCYGEFEKLGKIVMTPKAFHQSQANQGYRVYYSPVSRIVWELQPTSDPRYTSPRASNP